MTACPAGVGCTPSAAQYAGGGRRRADVLIEDRLQGNERGPGMRRDPRRGATTLIEFREPARVDRPDAEHERLEHDELHLRQRAARLVEQRRVLLLVVLQRARVAVRERVPKG